MTTHRTWRAVVGVVLAGLVAGVLAAAAPARADTIGTLTLTPKSGKAFTALTVMSSSGCPSTATNFVIAISGGSIGATPQNINGNSGLSSIPANPGQTTPMTVPLSKVLDQVRSDAGLSSLQPGTYTLTFVCRKALLNASLGDFVGTFQITAAMTAGSEGGYVAVTPGAPTSSKLPTISGTARVGSKLTCAHGTWAGSPTGYTYRWLRNGAAIGGATKTTYTPAASDYKKSVACQVTAKNAKGSTPATSAAKKVALGVALKASVKPAIKGTAKVGKKLTAVHGTWKPSASKYTYVWKRGSTTVSHASSYTLKKADKGKKVTVTVTASRTGYASGHATSKAVTVK